jgi:hypothetical protein
MKSYVPCCGIGGKDYEVLAAPQCLTGHGDYASNISQTRTKYGFNSTAYLENLNALTNDFVKLYRCYGMFYVEIPEMTLLSRCLYWITKNRGKGPV